MLILTIAALLISIPTIWIVFRANRKINKIGVRVQEVNKQHEDFLAKYKEDQALLSSQIKTSYQNFETMNSPTTDSYTIH